MKVYLPAARQYVPGQTSNVSVGGALVELRTARPLGIGDTLSIGVSWGAGALLRDEQLVGGRVVRVLSRTKDAQKVAVKFVVRQALAAAA